MKIDLASINWPAVAVSTVATFVVGGMWYGGVFKKLWQRLHGYSDEQVEQMKKARPPAVFLGVMIGAYCVISVAISILIGATGIHTVMGGVTLGLVIWAGFVVTVALTDWISSRRSLASFALDWAYQLVFLVLMGAILGGWRS